MRPHESLNYFFSRASFFSETDEAHFHFVGLLRRISWPSPPLLFSQIRPQPSMGQASRHLFLPLARSLPPRETPEGRFPRRTRLQFFSAFTWLDPSGCGFLTYILARATGPRFSPPRMPPSFACAALCLKRFGFCFKVTPPSITVAVHLAFFFFLFPVYEEATQTCARSPLREPPRAGALRRMCVIWWLDNTFPSPPSR